MGSPFQTNRNVRIFSSIFRAARFKARCYKPCSAIYVNIYLMNGMLVFSKINPYSVIHSFRA